jgi:hypothetical protein
MPWQSFLQLIRADIFKSKTQENILTYLKMLPIYRIRDGAQELSKNDEIFERSIQIVSDKVPLALMPEGNHSGFRRLRNFVKGAFRIAIRAQEIANEEEVFILPVGLDYQDYQKFNQNLLINIGKPVSIKQFMPEYIENQAKGINSIREKISGEIKPLMIHIENTEVYDMYQDLRHIWNPRMKQYCGIRGRTLHHAFKADKMMIRILDQAWETEQDSVKELAETTKTYMQNLSKLSMRNWVIARKAYSSAETLLMFLRILLTFPIALYGAVNNFLPYYLPVRATRKIKDPQFVSSFKFVITILLFPAFYLIQTLLVGWISGSGLIALGYLLSLPFTGYYAFMWTSWFKKLRASVKFRKMYSQKNPLLLETINLYVKIMQTMERISAAYLHQIPLKEKKTYE